VRSLVLVLERSSNLKPSEIFIAMLHTSFDEFKLLVRNAVTIVVDDSPLVDSTEYELFSEVTNEDLRTAIESYQESETDRYKNLLLAELTKGQPDDPRGFFSDLVKPNKNSPNAYYDLLTLQFYTQKPKARHKTVDIETLDDIRNRIETQHLDRVWLLTDRRATGKISNSEWERLTAKELKKLHIQSYLLGRGGINAMTLQDKQYVDSLLRQEMAYFRNFAQELRDNKLTIGKFRDRASMYVAKTRGFYEEGKHRSAIENDFILERRVRRAVESCQECLDYAAKGWVKIGELPTPTYQCTCRSRCKCIKEYSKDWEKLREPKQQSTPAQPPKPAKLNPALNKPKNPEPDATTYKSAIALGKKEFGALLENLRTEYDIHQNDVGNIIKRKAELTAALLPIQNSTTSADRAKFLELIGEALDLDVKQVDMRAKYEKAQQQNLNKIYEKLIKKSSITEQEANDWANKIYLFGRVRQIESEPFWRKELALFYRVSNGKISTLDEVSAKEIDRGYADLKRRKIDIAQNYSKTDNLYRASKIREMLWHELSHHIEFTYPDIAEIDVEWRKKVSLNKLIQLYPNSTDPEALLEEAFPSTKFFTPYTGKVYSATIENGKRFEATEVLTTGSEAISSIEQIERYLSSKVDFEHLHLILGLLSKKR